MDIHALQDADLSYVRADHDLRPFELQAQLRDLPPPDLNRAHEDIERPGKAQPDKAPGKPSWHAIQPWKCAYPRRLSQGRVQGHRTHRQSRCKRAGHRHRDRIEQAAVDQLKLLAQEAREYPRQCNGREHRIPDGAVSDDDFLRRAQIYGGHGARDRHVVKGEIAKGVLQPAVHVLQAQQRRSLSLVAHVHLGLIHACEDLLDVIRPEASRVEAGHQPPEARTRNRPDAKALIFKEP
jgi:hypothetical protein